MKEEDCVFCPTDDCPCYEQMIDEIDRLRRCLAKQPNTYMIAFESGRHEQLVEALMNANDKIARLESALKPFAEEADSWKDHQDDEHLVEAFPGYEGIITVGHCRKAKEILGDVDEKLS